MILVDATSIIWLVVAVLWGYLLAQVLIALFENWWRIERAISEWWGNLSFVSDLRERRAREDLQWWWVNATPEERDRYRRSTKAMVEIAHSLTAIIKQVGITAEQASEAFQSIQLPRNV